MMSIRRALLAWLLGVLLAGIAVAAVGTYWRARDEANTLFDHQLQEMVASLTDAPFAAAPAGPGSVAGADALVVQIWDRNGVQLYLSQPQRELPQHAQLGFTNLHTAQGEWRVFSRWPGHSGCAADAGAARTGDQHGAAHDRAPARGHAGTRASDLAHHRPRPAAPGARRSRRFTPLPDSA
jgi:hypothetical protein